jgi:small subunit ribosomal protein S4e
MGSKGSSRHKKRLSAPISYPIERKHGVFTIRANPTGAPFESTIPLGIIMREMLGYARTLNEVKKVLAKQIVKIDGKIQTNYKFGVRPMDVVEITKTDEFFRLSPYRGKRRLILHPIAKEDAYKKLLRIHKKHTIKKGIIQLTFHDGRNLSVNPDDKLLSQINEIAPKDSVLFNLETKTIDGHYPFREGNVGLIVGGHNVGLFGTIQEIETQIGRKKRTITLETEEGIIKTTDNHIFIIGQNEPLIEVPKIEGVNDNES